MHRVHLFCTLLCAFPRLALSADDLSIFRPHNVTGWSEVYPIIHDVSLGLYQFTGSYYNGSTILEFNYRADPKCENYRVNGTITRKFQSVFAVVPAASSNSTSNPVNMLWTLWPENYDIGTDYGFEDFTEANSTIFGSSETMKWFLNSFDLSEREASEEFPIAISKSKGDYYNVSGLTRNATIEVIGYFPFPACNGSGIKKGAISMLWPKLIDISPTFDFQFDDSAANATFVTPEGVGPSGLPAYLTAFNTSFELHGSVKLNMTASIDEWHSDILVGGGERPSWNLTVGYDKDYFGYPNSATVNLYSFSSLAPAMLVALILTTFIPI